MACPGVARSNQSGFAQVRYAGTAFTRFRERSLVGPGRVERPTSRLSGVRSNHLSYEPDEVFVQQRPEGIGPSGHRRKEEEKRRGRHGRLLS